MIEYLKVLYIVYQLIRYFYLKRRYIKENILNFYQQSNYLDWKLGIQENPLKQSTKKTIIPGVPLLGSSTMKKDY